MRRRRSAAAPRRRERSSAAPAHPRQFSGEHISWLRILRRAPGAVTSQAMKFNATIVFEFTAHDVAEAGEQVNALLEHAREAALETRSIELSTAPGIAVSLPPVVSGR
jgi:hypothetical protein